MAANDTEKTKYVDIIATIVRWCRYSLLSAGVGRAPEGRTFVVYPRSGPRYMAARCCLPAQVTDGAKAETHRCENFSNVKGADRFKSNPCDGREGHLASSQAIICVILASRGYMRSLHQRTRWKGWQREF